MFGSEQTRAQRQAWASGVIGVEPPFFFSVEKVEAGRTTHLKVSAVILTTSTTRDVNFGFDTDEDVIEPLGCRQPLHG